MEHESLPFESGGDFLVLDSYVEIVRERCVADVLDDVVPKHVCVTDDIPGGNGNADEVDIELADLSQTTS